MERQRDRKYVQAGGAAASRTGMVPVPTTGPAVLASTVDAEQVWQQIADEHVAADAAIAVSKLANGSERDVLRSGAADPAWESDDPFQVASLSVDAAADIGGTASAAALVLGKASNQGIKVDTASPTYGWHDIIGAVRPKTSGANTPTLTLYKAGEHCYQYAFVANDVVDFDFHMPHDYVLGTTLYIHVHWSHTGTTTTGNATFQLYIKYAKGHNQANFSAEVNPAITYATVDIATTPAERHRVDEVACSSSGGSSTTLDTGNLEPDGLIFGRLILTSRPTLGGGGHLFVHTIDLHYQSTGLPTKQKAPAFYT